jgi:transposase
MPLVDPIIGMEEYKVVSTVGTNPVEITAEFVGKVECPHCQGKRLRKKDTFLREIRHFCLGLRNTLIKIKTHKFYCRSCGKYFNSRLPGILPYQQSSELFKDEVATRHHCGYAKSRLGDFVKLSSSTVERYYQRYLQLKERETINAFCPKILGIDEKHFTKKLGFMTTFADLRRRKVYDVALGRSEKSLAGFVRKIPHKENCKVALMDLCDPFRSLVKKNFPNALIVADRFHVIKLVNHHFVKTWALLDEEGRKDRALTSLMRRHEWNLKDEAQRARLRSYLASRPGLEAIYDFKQRLTFLLLSRVSSKVQARPLVHEFTKAIRDLKYSGFKPLVTLGKTLESWQEEIVRMWRFKKTNSITEGLHNRMEEILRRAYGMRNFENFRIRVKAFCG